MSRIGLIIILYLAAAGGCSAVTERAEPAAAEPDRLGIAVVAVDLNDYEVILRPCLDAVPVHIGDAYGGFGPITKASDKSPLPVCAYEMSFGVTRVRQDAVRVRATLDQKGTKSSASRELKLKKGEWRVLLLPSEAVPRCLFIFGCVENPAK